MLRLIALVGLFLVPFMLSRSSGSLESKEEGERLWKEAVNQRANAKSRRDLEAALDKFKEALDIFERIAYRDGVGQISNSMGTIYSDWGQYDKAVEHYEKSLEIKKTVDDLNGVGNILNNLGNVYSDWGRYAEAVEYYEGSLEIRKQVGDIKGEGGALNKLGNVYSNWGLHGKAICCFEKSLEIARKCGDVSGEGTVLNNFGVVYNYLGLYTKAIEYYNGDLAICRKVGDVRGEGQTLNNIGVVYKNWGHYAKAIECYEKSLEIQKQLGDLRGEGRTLNNIGVVYRKWGHYAQAIKYYEKSLELKKQVGDVSGQGGTLNNIGNVYKAWGHYAKAVECYEKSLELKKQVGDVRAQGDILTNFGNIYRDWGQYPEAAKYYEKSLDVARQLGDLNAEGEALNNIGLVYEAEGQYSQALTNFQKGLEIFKRIGVPTDWATNNVGNLYLDIGEIEKAEPFIKEGGYDSSLGRLCLIRDDCLSARKYYERLLRDAEQNRDTDSLFTAYTGLGVVSERQGDDWGAAEFFRKAIEVVEDLRSGLNPAERSEFYNVRTAGFSRTAPYGGLARVLIKLNKPLDALRESEYTKARMFAEGFSRRAEGYAPQAPRDVLDKDCQINGQLAALTRNLQNAFEEDNNEVIAVLESQVGEAKTKLATHVETLRKDYPLFAATKYPKPMSLDQTSVKDNEWVLAYHVTDSGIIIYLTRGKNIVKVFFKPTKEVDGLVRSFRQPLEIGPNDSLEEKLRSFDFTSGKKLSDLLLGDILSDLPRDEHVIIIPDGSLGTLPFEMLILNDKGVIKTDKSIPYVSDADFFGDRNPISYYQSFTALTLARLHAKQKITHGGLLCIADPVFDEKDERMDGVPRPNAATNDLTAPFDCQNLMAVENSGQRRGLQFQRLSLTSDLVKALSAMEKEKTDVYTGFSATKSNFLDNIGPLLSRYDRIVFATYSYFGNDLPAVMEPALVLTLVPHGTDGYLRMSEVMKLERDADVVALLASQSGQGRLVPGEGVLSMGRAFQYAGAKSVLMSLWSVSELTSVNLVIEFFRNMKEGKNKMEALALARSEIRNKGFDHPFFWAPFILVGEKD